MACIPIFLILSVFLVATNVKAQAKYTNTVPIGSSLSPCNGKNVSWSSPSGFFAFGFFPQGNSFAVGIWLLVNQTDHVIVWTPNLDDPLLSSNAILELSTTSGVILRIEPGKDSVNVTRNLKSAASSAAMLDSGNFVLLSSSEDVIWQSFDSTTNTILGGQVLTSGRCLGSSVFKSDQALGSFYLSMQKDGNLVAFPTNISSKVQAVAYWSSETPAGAELYLSDTGVLLLQKRGTQWCHILWTVSNPGKNNSIIYRATLDADGIFRLYSHHFPISNTRSSVTTKVEWSSLRNHCQVNGICGLNSFCQMVDKKADCVCYPGFAYLNSSIKSQGCYQNFTQDICNHGEEDHQRPTHSIVSLQHIWWANTPYTVIPLSEESCKESCLGDCNCWAALYTTYSTNTTTSCCKYNFPLIYGRSSNNISTTALFKVVLDNTSLPEEPNNGHVHPIPTFPSEEVESKNNTISILAISLACVACLCFALAVSSFIVYKHQHGRYIKLKENASFGLSEDFTLQSFSYEELERATDGFKEEIGRGCFGAVYKGFLSEGNRGVAVKRLERVVEEGVREFRAEMTTIGRTHHRNLVQLLGFCVEGSKKLLVYEFMSNGSLADLLFNATLRPAFRERVRFVLDVARGIFYLHEECRVHIIHCNLKPQNILLDATLTAKISDFGLARLMMPNQDESTSSLGYLAPERQRNSMISVKADVYSFGVVLFEVICCRRNIELNASTTNEITLCNWVYQCFEDAELNKLVKDEEFDFPTLERMVKVGLWCVQDNPALRPLMKNVILMLEGTVDIPVPPRPER